MVGAEVVTEVPIDRLNICCELPPELVAVIVMGPKVSTDVGVPLITLLLRVNQEGLPVIDTIGTGVPVVVIVYEYGVFIMPEFNAVLVNEGRIIVSPSTVILSNLLLPLVPVFGAVNSVSY